MKADTTIPDYVLHFNITDDTLDYTACLQMSSNGRVISDLDFPNTAKYSNRLFLLNQVSARKIAIKKSVKKGHFSKGLFRYDKDRQIFVWGFDIIYDNSNVIHKNGIIIINANTGDVIEETEGSYYIR